MYRFFLALTFLITPSSFSYAQIAPPRDFKGLVAIITDLISTLILIIFALTFLVFMWGVIKGWIMHGGDAEGVTSGKNVVIVGIIALVVMSGIWGILSILQTSFFGR